VTGLALERLSRVTVMMLAIALAQGERMTDGMWEEETAVKGGVRGGQRASLFAGHSEWQSLLEGTKSGDTAKMWGEMLSPGL
jgi:hypothetical protein